MPTADIIHDNAAMAKELSGHKLNVYGLGTIDYIAYELGWEGKYVLETRADGQVYAIESLGGGEYAAVVPEDLAREGKGAVYENLEDAYHYLIDLVGKYADAKLTGKQAHDLITETIAKMYRGEITNEQAIMHIERRVSSMELSEFLVDAFNRGWITRFNLGIDEDGKVI